jgi:hypothetical protein
MKDGSVTCFRHGEAINMRHKPHFSFSFSHNSYSVLVSFFSSFSRGGVVIFAGTVGVGCRSSALLLLHCEK